MPIPVENQIKSRSRANSLDASMNFHITPGSDKIVVVSGNSGDNILSATYDGVPMTALGPQAVRVRQFYMVDPPAGINEIVVTMDGLGMQVVHAVSLTLARVGNFP